MATNEDAGTTKPAPKRSRRSSTAAADGARRSRGRAANRTSARGGAKRTRGGAAALAERVVLVQVGAGLLARESLVSTVKGIAERYGTRTAVEREINRCEHRGERARKGAEHRVHQARTRLERQVRAVGRDLEREARSVGRDLERHSANAQRIAERIAALT